MPVPDRVRDDVSGIQVLFLFMVWIPAFAGMTAFSEKTTRSVN